MAAESLVEEVATNLEEVAQVTRAVNTQVVSAFMGGTIFGAIVGAVFGYRFGKQRTKAEALREAQAEIDEMREHYHRKTMAAQNDEVKKQVDETIHLEGYVQERPGSFMPMANTERPLPAPVPIMPDDATREVQDQSSWNYSDEFNNRRAGTPYVIHEDEFANDNLPMYNPVQYTYYGRDGVLADEDNDPIHDVEEIIGKHALNRFGHGSSDPNIVYVRNDKLQLQIEICRDPNGSYEHVVEGLDDAPDSA